MAVDMAEWQQKYILTALLTADHSSVWYGSFERIFFLNQLAIKPRGIRHRLPQFADHLWLAVYILLPQRAQDESSKLLRPLL